jgi:hypothetical protein
MKLHYDLEYHEGLESVQHAENLLQLMMLDKQLKVLVLEQTIHNQLQKLHQVDVHSNYYEGVG